MQVARVPGFLADEHQIVRQPRFRLQHVFKRVQKSHVILARLQIADGEHERPPDSEFPLDRRPRHFALDGPELAGDGVRHHHHFVFGDAIVLQNRAAGIFARREHAGRALHRLLHRQAQLERTKPGEVLRILQKAHIVHADHQGSRAEQRTRILHVQQIRTIAPEMPGQVHAQTLVGILRDTPRPDPARQIRLGALLRDIGDQFAAFVQAGELLQKVADINFVSGLATADRVRVN